MECRLDPCITILLCDLHDGIRLHGSRDRMWIGICLQMSASSVAVKLCIILIYVNISFTAHSAVYRRMSRSCMRALHGCVRAYTGVCVRISMYAAPS